MKKLVFFENVGTMMYPNGEIATRERLLQDFPAIGTFKHVIETDDNMQVCFAVENFAAMKSRYEIDSSLSDNAALSALEEIINTPQEVPAYDDQTRIADALEDLVVLNMPDEEV